MVSGQARLRGWSSSSSSSRILGKIFQSSVIVHTVYTGRTGEEMPHLVYVCHTVHRRRDLHRDLCAVGDVFISFRKDRKERSDFRGYFFPPLEIIKCGLIREVLKLSTVILSQSLCLQDGSYVEKQNMLVI